MTEIQLTMLTETWSPAQSRAAYALIEFVTQFHTKEQSETGSCSYTSHDEAN